MSRTRISAPGSPVILNGFTEDGWDNLQDYLRSRPLRPHVEFTTRDGRDAVAWIDPQRQGWHEIDIREKKPRSDRDAGGKPNPYREP